MNLRQAVDRYGAAAVVLVALTLVVLLLPGNNDDSATVQASDVVEQGQRPGSTDSPTDLLAGPATTLPDGLPSTGGSGPGGTWTVAILVVSVPLATRLFRGGGR